MTIQEYLSKINIRYKSGISHEHSYRGELQQLIETVVPDILITNEPTRVACGAPDYIITKKGIPVGYIEAKDVGKPLDSKDYKEQFERYKKSLPNLIITDYLDFWLFRDGKYVTAVRIGEIVNGKIKPLKDNYQVFTDLINSFCTYIGQTIQSPIRLSKMMATKARMLATVIENALLADENDSGSLFYETANNTLRDQLAAFKNILIHDISEKEFGDIYAQTIAYGMFAARLHDPTIEDFSRQEAAELIPKSNPFLRKLFQYVAGYDLDERIKWIVDDLADIFRATDVAALLKNFGNSTQQNDPIIHFYETFLAEYDPKLRKSRGVWYTPEPVVNFIVRAVDDILKAEFGLSQGLADTTKTKIKLDTQVTDKRTDSGYKKQEVEVHKVQILDPACGTGTFLAEVVKHIYKQFEGQQGIWSNYVENHLIPRLNGFEILMASYAMAHLKLELLLQETGFKPYKQQRLRVYLTNSLEEHHPDTGTLFASWLSSEASEANHIKRDTPVMVVLGNPPYSGISSNMGEWIVNMIEDYKYVDGEHFKERKHWLHDDYVKFIRYGQHFVQKNGEGILAFINNHSFLDNPTFRGMRWHLLNSFDTIYIIDLHGNSLKKEVCPDGSPDKNVFDIQAGVSINLFIKTGKKKKGEQAKVLHIDFWGDRENKYQKLWNSQLNSLDFKEVEYTKPFYFCVPKNDEGRYEYENGFSVNDMFPLNVTGIVTMGDAFIVADTKEELRKKLIRFLENDLTEEELKSKYSLGKNYAKWIIGNKNKIKIDEKKFVQIDYRPFDIKWTYFDNLLIWRWREKVMQHFFKGENVGLMTCRQIAINKWEHVGITKNIADDSRVSNRSRERGYIFPLYLYSESETDGIFSKKGRKPNLNMVIVGQMAEKLELEFTPEKDASTSSTSTNSFTPIDILDYIYAILHSTTYREKYKEFLKIDFPRVPYPKDKDTFWHFVELGDELRQINLLENPVVEQFITSYPIDGDNIITGRILAKDFEIIDAEKKIGRLWINDNQYFDGIPVVAWEYYIGGYQPAQKWLKDRRRRELSFDDIRHYQKIIVALTETDRIMKEIDKIEFD